jgi:hypothetical protein
VVAKELRRRDEPPGIGEMVKFSDKAQQKETQKAYPAEKVRQGEIVLRKPWQRIVFIAGLIVPFVLLFIWLIVRQ